MRNILHLISTAGPGGAETVYLSLVGSLDPGRWRSTPVTPELDWLTVQLLRGGFQPVLAASRSRFDFAYLGRLARLVRERSVDVIHAHLFGPGVEASLVGLVTGVPVVCTVHGRGDLLPNEKLRRLKFAVLNLGLARAVFVSDSLREYYLQQGPLRRELTAVIPNGIDVSSYDGGGGASVLAGLDLPPDRFIVGAVGNLREIKRYDLLIRAAALLKQRSPDYLFVIAGQAPPALLATLTREAAELGVQDSVRFIGFQEDVASVLRSFDIFALTSDSEGFSIATVQAMASSLPIIATRCGGPEEILTDTRTGLFVDPGSEHQLANAIERLRADPERRLQLGTAARQTAETRFSLQAQVQSYEQLYEEVIAERGRGAPARARLQPRPEKARSL